MAHSGRTGPSAQWMKKAFASTEKLQEIADKNSLFDGANRGSDYVAPPEESPSADTKDTATYENAARAESSQPDRNHWLETFVILLAGILTVGILLLLKRPPDKFLSHTDTGKTSTISSTPCATRPSKTIVLQLFSGIPIDH